MKKKAEEANAYYNKQPAKMNVYDAGESVQNMPVKKTEESHKQCSPGEFGMNKEGNQFLHRKNAMNAFQFGQRVKTALDMNDLGMLGLYAGGGGAAGAGLGGLYGAVSGAMQAEKGKRLRGALSGAGRGAIGGGIIGAGAGAGMGLMGTANAQDRARQDNFYQSTKHWVPDQAGRDYMRDQHGHLEDQLQDTRENLGLVGGGAAGAGLASLLLRKKKDTKEAPTA
jgi:hypothetical protein